MEKLNKKLIQELDSPFHAYLLLGNTSSQLLSQAKIFGSKILFGVEEERAIEIGRASCRERV